MQEINSLRIKAKQKRDAAIAKARQEYRQTMKQITAVKRAIVGKPPRPAWRVPQSGDSLTLREAMIASMGDRQLTKIQIAVAVVEWGYQSRMPRRELMRKISKILRTDERFKRQGEKWALASLNRPRAFLPQLSRLLEPGLIV